MTFPFSPVHSRRVEREEDEPLPDISPYLFSAESTVLDKKKLEMSKNWDQIVAKLTQFPIHAVCLILLV